MKELYGKIPKDPFTNEDFKYVIADGIYKLYSVGQNIIDDGGIADKGSHSISSLDYSVFSNEPKPEPRPFVE